MHHLGVAHIVRTRLESVEEYIEMIPEAEEPVRIGLVGVLAAGCMPGLKMVEMIVYLAVPAAGLALMGLERTFQLGAHWGVHWEGAGCTLVVQVVQVAYLKAQEDRNVTEVVQEDIRAAEENSHGGEGGRLWVEVVEDFLFAKLGVAHHKAAYFVVEMVHSLLQGMER